jgi:hypothetical protein
MAQSEALETYSRTLRTMSQVSEALRDQPDPGGTLRLLADRIDIERRWVRTLIAAGKEPRRPPEWFCGSSSARSD